jgi:biotin carboxyl carrier protein
VSKKILVCRSTIENDLVALACPIIGRVILSVSEGQTLARGQIIGEIWRLDQRYLLRSPDEVSGVVAMRASRDRVMPCAFGQRILTLQQGEAQGSVRKDAGQKIASGSNSVDAPMDGMFYLSASPKDPPYVKVGDTIAPGQTIGLIEVMKCFYPLKYQGMASAKIVDIRVSSASPVSSGTKLMIVQIN